MRPVLLRPLLVGEQGLPDSLGSPFLRTWG